MNEWGIHQEQGLSWRRRWQSLGHTLIGIGSIEQGQERMTTIALNHQVDTAMVRIIDRMKRTMDGEAPGCCRGEWMRRCR